MVIIMTSNLGTRDISFNNLGFGEELVPENQKTIDTKFMKSVDQK